VVAQLVSAPHCHCGGCGFESRPSRFQENFMDYKALLLKYMEYISESEGSDFTGRTLEFSNLFSNDEKTELRSLSKVNSYKDNSKPKIRKG
jgi:hypothetical protein